MARTAKELSGTSEFKIIHSILALSDNYGYEILQKAKELSNDETNWNIGKVYMILKKMEASGLIFSYWKTSNDDRPRRYYRMAEKGNNRD